MNLLITGGAGFIGSAIAAEAVRRGHAVWVLDALTYAGHPQNMEGLNVTLIEGDILDRKLVTTLLHTHAIDVVIHAAAESHVDNSIAASGAFITTNINGTHSMLEACRDYWAGLPENKKPQFRFLHISTDEVYGALGTDGEFLQSSTMLPNSPYAASKAASDHLVRAWQRTYGLPTLITRCCNNYGPRQHPEKLIPHMITRALSGQSLTVYGDGMQCREWIHVEDHALAIFTVLEHAPIGSITHIGSGDEMPNLKLVQALRELVRSARGVDAPIEHVADRAGHDFRYALSLQQNQVRLPQPRSFEEGLRSTVQWYLDHSAWIATMQAHTKEKRRCV